MKTQRPSEIGTVGWIRMSPARVSRSVTKHFREVVPIPSSSGCSLTPSESGRIGSKSTTTGSSPGAESRSAGGSIWTGNPKTTSSEVPSAKRVHERRAGSVPSVLTRRRQKSDNRRWTTASGSLPAFARLTWTSAPTVVAGCEL